MNSTNIHSRERILDNSNDHPKQHGDKSIHPMDIHAHERILNNPNDHS
jgi:hypothetical protein